MRHDRLVTLVVLGLLASPARAPASDSAPVGVAIESVRTQGAGCSPDGVVVDISADGQALTVLFSEFGVPTGKQPTDPCSPSPGPAVVSEAEAASYVGRALRSLHDCGSTGAMLWCHSDYDPALFDTPPFDLAVHERSFGQWRADASPKPSVDVVRFFVEHAAALPVPEPLAQSAWFDLDVEQYYRNPEAELPRLYRRYCSAAARQQGAPDR